ncbi:NAD(P)/FAD-dependent oxidoreductase [Dactylosporangium sp. AC04546]|uniref:flavin-containing monooxygenase n=1 Tax=Dactylosporangium sp. AC04546 TaxID=2862460 RepID=UPI001EDCED36|nr:NAD(P)/FAD-dependent oxidoreductase [Dactylosporangium sp. AC04546]WVK86949.1 NAD(P)/FAD-dependent oxidoreductase [Dactylosporangium sp. AC04546]
MKSEEVDVSGTEFDVVIVGAGFAGMQMLYRVRELGLRARVFEAGGDVGGTWYWNRYPGARCDVESVEYSYQFSPELQQEWEWTERYATQPEILRYANHVADRFDLRRHIQFDTRVSALVYDETSDRWTVRAATGGEVLARFVIMASGCLSSANLPGFAGMETFAGEVYHTGRWPHEGVDLSGKRVGVVGTGSSGVQAVPVIAEQAGALYVFQRTAAYTLPAGNHPLDPGEQAAIKADYVGFRAQMSLRQSAGNWRVPPNPASIFDATPSEREAEFEARWARGGPGVLGAYADIMVDQEANGFAAEFVRGKIREIVKDPEVAALLSPDQIIGCKRICLDTGYYEAFNRPHVHLVDVATAPIERLTPRGIRTAVDEYELDVIVFATGFDAMTGALLSVDIRGRGGLSLREKWLSGPRTYLGLGVPGFPNLFTVTGPGSPSVLTNMMVSIHHHVNWIGDCLKYLQDHRIASIEASADAEVAWVEHVNEVADKTLYPSCNSWYLGANIPGKTRVFMPLLGFPAYVQRCATVAANGYEGFDLAGDRRSDAGGN